MTRLKRLGTLILLPLALLSLLLTIWVTGTSSGLHWLLTRAAMPKALEIDTIEGTLLSGLRLSGIRYHNDKVKITLDELLLDWRPSALLKPELRAEMLYLQHLRIELPPSDDQPLKLPDIHLPITIQLDDVQVNHLEIIKPKWPAIEIKNASLRGKANRGGVMVQYLDINSETAQLSLRGTLHPYADYWHKLDLQWQLQADGHPTLNGSGKLTGDLHQTTLHHTLTHPIAATAELTLFELLQTPRWQASLTVPKQPLNQIYPDWPAEPAALTARGSGDFQRATIGAFTLETLGSRARGAGGLDWEHGLKWRSTVEVGRFDFTKLWALLKVNGPTISSSFKASLAGDLEHLTFDRATLHTLGGTLSGNGEVRWNAPLLWQTRLNAQGVELGQLLPLLALDGHGLPEGRINLATTMQGGQDRISFKQLSAESLGASLRGDVELRWRPQLEWQAALEGDGLDPAVWQPQRFAAWPGNLSPRFVHHGSYAHGELQGEVDLQQLNGDLRGYPIELQTRLALRPGRVVEIDSLVLDSAESHVEANGTLGETVALHWRLDSPQLAQLYPDISGALKLSGQLNGALETPLLQFDLDGKKLAYAGAQIGSIRSSGTVQLFSWQQILLDLYSRDLLLAGRPIETLEMHARGDAADHTIKLQLGMEKLEALWRLGGAFDPQRQEWKGEIKVADMNNPELGLWQLAAPARLFANADELRLEPLCWYQQSAQLCVKAERQQQIWQGELDGRELSLSLLTPWLPRDLEMGGTVALRASARHQPQHPLNASARIEIGPGQISYPLVENERSEWRFEEGRLQGTLDEQGAHTQLHLKLAGKDRIEGTLDLPGYEPLTTKLTGQPLKGEVKAAFSDLGLLNTLFYEIQGLKGKIELDSKIGGTIAQPELTGQLQLHNGQLQIPRLGLSLKELEFAARSSGNDLVNYRLQVRSGDGRIEAKGQTQLNAKEGWPTRISLSGNEFEASHIPEARIVISPKLEMKMARREIWLDGEVEVPEARLQPKEFSSAATPSDDVVIVGAPDSGGRPWLIHNRVRLILGDSIALYGFGFEGNIKGNLLLIDEPGKITAASGELSVVAGGHYRAYGQDLEVEQGRLLFASGPITNPVLDLRAVRHIGDVTAGVKVNGLLRQPEFELYSIPAMDQSDALSYMVLGRPMDQVLGRSDGNAMAQAALALGLKGGDMLARSIGDRFGLDVMRIESSGKGEQAALVMGRYLSPRLYVGYSAGIMDAVNTFVLRYQLSNRWQLKAESGITQSGDLIYSIEP